MWFLFGFVMGLRTILTTQQKLYWSLQVDRHGNVEANTNMCVGMMCVYTYIIIYTVYTYDIYIYINTNMRTLLYLCFFCLFNSGRGSRHCGMTWRMPHLVPERPALRGNMAVNTSYPNLEREGKPPQIILHQKDEAPFQLSEAPYLLQRPPVR